MLKTTGHFTCVSAETIKGGTTNLVIVHSDDMVALGARRIKKLTHKVIDVSGAADGANCEVRMEWLHRCSASSIEVARIKETVGELRAVFEEAGYRMPSVQRSFTGRLRDARDRILNVAPV